MRKNIRDYINTIEGFSLFEVMTVALLFLVLLSIGYIVLGGGKNSYDVLQNKMSLQHEIRKAINRMTPELRQTSASYIADVPADNNWHEQITFQVPSSYSNGTIWSEQIVYSLGGTNNTQLIKSTNTTSEVLATNVEYVGFKRFPSEPEIINIRLDVKKPVRTGFTSQNMTINIDTQVKMRN